jgi:hypothetical protein
MEASREQYKERTELNEKGLREAFQRQRPSRMRG